jgi:5'-methylthioadenosine phosphorylase
VSPTNIKIGIIGGAGLDDLEEMTERKKFVPETPFGSPSDYLLSGSLQGAGVVFLPRHGRGYRLLPHEIPGRANIYALKSLGVERLISVNSCGSFKEEIRPGDLLIPDQLIDRTQGRAGSFSGEGVIFHISLAEPFCFELSRVLISAAREAGITVHQGGTCLTVEGPALSTRAEAQLYKSWGADVIAMTVLPEAKLAREAAMCYASLCLVTDYAGSQETAKGLNAAGVAGRMQQQLAVIKNIIRRSIDLIPEKRRCLCSESLTTAMVTDTDRLTIKQKKRLGPVLGNG